MKVKALILIGGKSTRMGEDKYLLGINGKPQYQYLHDLLTAAGLDVSLSINGGQSQVIPATYNTIVDQYNEIGPMGGLISAITLDSKSSWLIVACDLIHLDKRALQELIQANEETYDIITYQEEGSPFFETTCTLYNPGSYILLKRALRNREYSLQNILRKASVKTVIPYKADILHNANVPEDLG